MTDFPDLPTFLRRGHPDCVVDKPAKLIFESPPCAGHSRPLAAPTEEETTAMTKKPAAKKAAKKRNPKLPATHPANRGPKTRAKKAAPKKARANARKPADGKVSNTQLIADMMSRPNGASTEEMVKATGIEAHPLRAKIYQVRHTLGYDVTSPNKDNGMRYHATPPAPKAEG